MLTSNVIEKPFWACRRTSTFISQLRTCPTKSGNTAMTCLRAAMRLQYLLARALDDRIMITSSSLSAAGHELRTQYAASVQRSLALSDQSFQRDRLWTGVFSLELSTPRTLYFRLHFLFVYYHLQAHGSSGSRISGRGEGRGGEWQKATKGKVWEWGIPSPREWV